MINFISDNIYEPWFCKPTGNMTISIIDNRSIQLFRVDMLRSGTMKAGDNGNLLARTYNDLSVICAFTKIIKEHQIGKSFSLVSIIPHPDIGLSPLPWTIEKGIEFIRLRDANHRLIAEARITRRNHDTILASLNFIESALLILPDLLDQ